MSRPILLFTISSIILVLELPNCLKVTSILCDKQQREVGIPYNLYITSVVLVLTATPSLEHAIETSDQTSNVIILSSR